MGSIVSCFNGDNRDTKKKATTAATSPLKSSLKNDSFVWKIDGFSSLLKQGNKMTQTGFSMQNYNWYLGVNPMHIRSTGDNSSEKYLSLSLGLTQHTLTDCMLDTKFRFFLYDQKYGKHIEVEACHTYMINNYHSGAYCMISLKELEKACSRYLLYDTIAVGVELIQVKRLSCSVESTNLLQKDGSSGSYSWYIEDFSKLNRPHASSEPFHIAGYTWIISLYPEGDRDKNYVAIYLGLDTVKSQLPSSIGVMIYGTISIKKQSGESYSINLSDNYNSNGASWGISKFMSLENFKDPSNGYLVKGTCTIEVSVSIKGSSVGHK